MRAVQCDRSFLVVYSCLNISRCNVHSFKMQLQLYTLALLALKLIFAGIFVVISHIPFCSEAWILWQRINCWAERNTCTLSLPSGSFSNPLPCTSYLSSKNRLTPRARCLGPFVRCIKDWPANHRTLLSDPFQCQACAPSSNLWNSCCKWKMLEPSLKSICCLRFFFARGQTRGYRTLISDN